MPWVTDAVHGNYWIPDPPADAPVAEPLPADTTITPPPPDVPSTWQPGEAAPSGYHYDIDPSSPGFGQLLPDNPVYGPPESAPEAPVRTPGTTDYGNTGKDASGNIPGTIPSPEPVGSGGVTLAGGDEVKAADFNKLPEDIQKIGKEQGLEAMNEAIKQRNVQQAGWTKQEKLDWEENQRIIESQYNQEVAKQNDALDKLKGYRTGDGSNRHPYGYDLNSYLLETESPSEALKTLKEAGFSQETILQAALQNNGMAIEARKQVQEQYSAAGVAKYTGNLAANMVVPGYYTAGNWSNMGAGQKALSIGMDVLTLIPFVPAAAAGAREVAVAGRIDRLAGAAKGLGKEVVGQVRAPVTMIAHPVATVKGTVATIRDLGETLLHPRKIPEAVLTTAKGTVRLRITDTTTPAEAKTIMDKMVELSKAGEKPVIEVNGTQYELSVPAIMKENKGGLSHASPDVSWTKEGAQVTANAGKPADEQGLFMAHQPTPDFAQQNAFGGITNAAMPGNANHNVQVVSLFKASDLVQVDKMPVRPLNFADSKNIPPDLARDIQKYAETNNARLYGSFNEWTKVPKAAKPNDVDLAFRDQKKAMGDILAIAQKAGYEAKLVPHGVAILKDGKWVKLGDIASDTEHNAIIGKLATKGHKVNGIEVETLGEQYLRQSMGAVAGDAKAGARSQKLKVAAGEVKKLLKEAGAGKVEPGFYITSPESAQKAVSTEKLYGGKATQGIPSAEAEEKFIVNEWVAKPKQKLFTRIGPQKTSAVIYLEKPLSKASIAKLKARGLVEDITAPFKPAITISKDMAGLDAKGSKELANILKQSGDERTARALDRLAEDALRVGERAGATGTRATIALRQPLRASDIRAQKKIDREITRIIEESRKVERQPQTPAERKAAREFQRQEAVARTDAARQTARTDSTRPADIRPDAARIEPARVEPPRENAPRVDNTDRTPPREGDRTPKPDRTPPPDRVPPPDRIPPPIIPWRKPPPPGDRPPRIDSGGGVEYPHLPHFDPGMTDKQKKKVIQEAKGAVTWRQGQLDGKDIWHVIIYPYQSKADHTTFVGRIPKGALAQRGPQSAYKTAQGLYGQPPGKELTLDVGIEDVHLSPEWIGSQRAIAITFKADPLQKTTSDINVSNRATTLTRPPPHNFPLGRRA